MPAPPRVLVVGAGPAGLATAAALGAQGIRALVWEGRSEPLPRYGECLGPGAAQLLQRFGIELGGQHLRCPRFVARWSQTELDERSFLFDPRGEGWIVDRLAFERQLDSLATRRGAVIARPVKLMGLKRRREGWKVTGCGVGSTRQLEVDFIVDATGRASVVTQRLGVPRLRGPRLVASWTLLEESAEDASVRVEAAPTGWWYSVQVPGERRCLAFMSDCPLRDPPAFLASAPATIRPVVAPRWLRHDCARGMRSRHACSPGWLAVGDAALALDPLASNGLTFALASALYAAHCIRDAALGNADAYAAYEALVTSHWEADRVSRSEAYAACRFAAEPFWKKRSRPHSH